MSFNPERIARSRRRTLFALMGMFMGVTGYLYSPVVVDWTTAIKSEAQIKLQSLFESGAKSGANPAPTPTPAGKPPAPVGAETATITALLTQTLDSNFSILASFGNNVSAGSGFLITEGVVATNAHVVGTAQTIKITSFGRREQCEADVFYREPTNDIALARITRGCQGIPPLKYNPDHERNQAVILIGNPLNKGLNISTGKILELDHAVNTTQARYKGFAHSANTLPGNSGCAVFNQQGHVIGVNSASDSGQPSNQKRAYAIPIRDFVSALQKANK